MRKPYLTSFALFLALGAVLPLEAATPGTFQFPKLNRQYSMGDPDLAPIQQGPITIRLSSPKNLVILQGHQLKLTPRGDGTFDAEISADFLGKGEVQADFETSAGTSSRLADEILLPRQTVRVSSRVRFARVAGGYDVTALTLPKSVGIDVRSRLMTNLVGLCNGVALLMPVDCNALDRGLTRVEVPLPEAGSVFYLSEADLTPEERQSLESFLGLAKPPK